MNGRWRVLRNAATGKVVLARARWCSSFLCHLRGLMFVSDLPSDEGLLFVTGSESRANSTIHMLFMRISIGVVWLDQSGRVVDKVQAKPWRLAYGPRQPAQYYIEANTDILDRVKIGDVLRFDEVVS